MNNHEIEKMMSNYNVEQKSRIQDFLISEIGEDTIQELIEFAVSSREEQLEKYGEFLYIGAEYEGLFLEGNQYLVSSASNRVLLIDMVSEEHGVNPAVTRVSLPLEFFIEMISNKKAILEWIRQHNK